MNVLINIKQRILLQDSFRFFRVLQITFQENDSFEILSDEISSPKPLLKYNLVGRWNNSRILLRRCHYSEFISKKPFVKVTIKAPINELWEDLNFRFVAFMLLTSLTSFLFLPFQRFILKCVISWRPVWTMTISFEWDTLNKLTFTFDIASISAYLASGSINIQNNGLLLML